MSSMIRAAHMREKKKKKKLWHFEHFLFFCCFWWLKAVLSFLPSPFNKQELISKKKKSDDSPYIHPFSNSVSRATGSHSGVVSFRMGKNTKKRYGSACSASQHTTAVDRDVSKYHLLCSPSCTCVLFSVFFYLFFFSSFPSLLVSVSLSLSLYILIVSGHSQYA